MSDPHGAAHVSHLEAHALQLEQAHERRRLIALAVTATAIGYVYIAAMAQRPVVTALAVILVMIAAAVWGLHLWRDRGRDGRVRRAWRAWLTAMSWQESAEALFVVFRAYHPAVEPSAQYDLGVRDLEALRVSALDGQVAEESLIFRTMHRLMLEDLDQRVAEAKARRFLDDARAEAQAILAAAEAERVAILRKAHLAAADLRAGVEPPAPPPADPPPAVSPWTAYDPQVAELRRLFELATREAAKGSVHESAAAAVILSHPARWSAYAPPQPVSETLLALFDPLCASLPPPPPSKEP